LNAAPPFQVSPFFPPFLAARAHEKGGGCRRMSSPGTLPLYSFPLFPSFFLLLSESQQGKGQAELVHLWIVPSFTLRTPGLDRGLLSTPSFSDGSRFFFSSFFALDVRGIGSRRRRLLRSCPYLLLFLPFFPSAARGEAEGLGRASTFFW